MSSSSAKPGVSLGGLTFLLFLALKLTDNIDWSWWWVTSPLWGPLALALSLFTIAGVISTPFIAVAAINKKRIKGYDEL